MSPDFLVEKLIFSFGTVKSLGDREPGETSNTSSIQCGSSTSPASSWHYFWKLSFVFHFLWFEPKLKEFKKNNLNFENNTAMADWIRRNTAILGRVNRSSTSSVFRPTFFVRKVLIHFRDHKENRTNREAGYPSNCSSHRMRTVELVERFAKGRQITLSSSGENNSDDLARQTQDPRHLATRLSRRTMDRNSLASVQK